MERLSDLFSRGLDLVTAGLLALVVAFPALPALIYLLQMFTGFQPESLLLHSVNPATVLAYIVASTDSGAQGASGSAALRGLAFLAVALWLLLPRRLPRRSGPAVGALAVFLVLSLASALAAPHLHDAVLAWADWLAVAMVGLVTWELAATHSSRATFLGFGLVCLVLAALLPAAFFSYLLEPSYDGRLRGSFFHPNMMASYLLLFVPPLISLVFAPGRREEIRALAGVPLLCGALVALALTSSRIAWGLALLALGPTLVLLSKEAKPWRWVCAWTGLSLGTLGAGLAGWVPLGVLGLVLLGAMTVALVAALDRPRESLMKLLVVVVLVSATVWSFGFEGQLDPAARVHEAASAGSVQARFVFWEAAAAMAVDHPWLGIGPDGFSRHYPLYQPDLLYFSKFVHCLPLTVAAECGFPALMAGLALVGLTVWAAVRRLAEEPDKLLGSLRQGLLIGAGAFLLHSCGDVQWQFLALPLTMAVLAGLGLAGSEPPCPEPANPVQRSQWSIRPTLLVQYSVSGLIVGLILLNAQVMFAEHYAAMGAMASRGGKPEVARDLYREAAALDPMESEHQRRLGLALLSLPLEGEEARQELIDAAQRSVALDPLRSVSHDLLGRARARLELPGSQESFQRALELDPINYPSYYVNLAEQLPQERAWELLDQARRRFPLEVIVRTMDFREETLREQLSDLLVRTAFLKPTGSPGDVEPLFREAIEARQNNPDAWFGLGISLHEQRRFEEALEAFRKVQEIDPTARPNLEMLAATLAELGRRDEALEVLKALDKDPQPPGSPASSTPTPAEPAPAPAP